MPIDKIEQTYKEKKKYGLYQLQQIDCLTQLEKIDNDLISALEKEEYDEVITKLDELCYLFVLMEEEKTTLLALEIYYTSLLTMLLRNLLKKRIITDIHLSNVAAIIAIIKKWDSIKDYLYFTPWFVTKLKELLEENTILLNLNSYVYQAILIIKKELYNPNLSTSYIAKKLNVSKSYLCYLFKQDYTEPLTTLINKVRLKHAVIDIKMTHLPLNAIMKKYGFNSYSYFSKIFKKYYGLSPLQYRKQAFLTS